jgi:hypothetical protein
MNMRKDSERNAIHEAMLFYWGGRCPEHDAECHGCQAWEQYDKVVATAPEGVLRVIEIKEDE